VVEHHQHHGEGTERLHFREERAAALSHVLRRSGGEREQCSPPSGGALIRVGRPNGRSAYETKPPTAQGTLSRDTGAAWDN
jgi:hypothetical protein